MDTHVMRYDTFFYVPNISLLSSNLNNQLHICQLKFLFERGALILTVNENKKSYLQLLFRLRKVVKYKKAIRN